MDELRTKRLLLRSPQPADAPQLLAILQHPGVSEWWPGFTAERVWTDLISGDDDGDLTVLVIEQVSDGQVAGVIQFAEEQDPEFRHASLDLFLGSPFQGRGLGQEAIRAVIRHLIKDRGHHRLSIDPALANEKAIHAYERVGFRRVGVMRQYQRGADGSWRDGLLMELLAEEYSEGSPRVVEVQD